MNIKELIIHKKREKDKLSDEIVKQQDKLTILLERRKKLNDDLAELQAFQDARQV